MGHVLGHGQGTPIVGSLAALTDWERPTTISELRSFMGFCNYFSGYVRVYAEVSVPLHKILQAARFVGRKAAKNSWLGQQRRKKLETRSRELSWEISDYSLSIETKDLCSAPMHGNMLWEQFRSRSERMVSMSQWPFGVEFWRRGNAALGLQWKRRRTPKSVPCASRPGILVFNPLSCAPTIKVCRVGTRSTLTPLGSGSPKRLEARDASQV